MPEPSAAKKTGPFNSGSGTWWLDYQNGTARAGERNQSGHRPRGGNDGPAGWQRGLGNKQPLLRSDHRLGRAEKSGRFLSNSARYPRGLKTEDLKKSFGVRYGSHFRSCGCFRYSIRCRVE